MRTKTSTTCCASERYKVDILLMIQSLFSLWQFCWKFIVIFAQYLSCIYSGDYRQQCTVCIHWTTTAHKK